MCLIRPLVIVDETMLPWASSGSVELTRIFCRACDFCDAVDAGCSAADIGCHGDAHAIFLFDCDCGVPRAAWDRARMIVRRARSILKSLCPKPLASRKDEIGRLRKGGFIGGPAAQRSLGLHIPPRLMRDAAERETRFLDRVAIDLEPGRDGDQRECVGKPVANLEVGMVCRKSFAGNSMAITSSSAPRLVSRSGLSPGSR